MSSFSFYILKGEKSIMPNWCSTQIIFHGRKDEIKGLHKKINEWTRESSCETDFGRYWLGNILRGAGLGDRIDVEDGLRCRGAIEYVGDVTVFSDTDATFDIVTETAWGPMMKMWMEVIEACYYKSVGFSYMAEEPGCELYEVYDPYGDFDDAYYVDMYLAGDDELDDNLRKLESERYFTSEEQLMNVLKELLGKLDDEDETIESLINQVENYPFEDEDSYVRVYAYNYIGFDEICD